MALQLLCRFDTTDASAWQDAFRADAEDQRNAGLTLLQLWQDADGPATFWALFEVNDRAKADGWLTRAKADTAGRRAGVSDAQAHFLRTA